MERMLAPTFLVLYLLEGCAPVSAPESVHRAGAEEAESIPRRAATRPPDPRDAVPNRAWCLRTCRHLMRVQSTGAPRPGRSEKELGGELASCTETCRHWASPARLRCLLGAESLDDVRACTY